jgi:hypothetical protein
MALSNLLYSNLLYKEAATYLLCRGSSSGMISVGESHAGGADRARNATLLVDYPVVYGSPGTP